MGAEKWIDKGIMIIVGSFMTMIGFFATGYTQFVTKHEVPLYAPYPSDRPIILHHIEESNKILTNMATTTAKLNEKLDKELRQLDVRLSVLEKSAGR